MTLTTLPLLLAISLTLAVPPAQAAASVIRPVQVRIQPFAAARGEAPDVEAQPVLLAWEAWRLFGGAKENEETPGPATPPMPTEKPRPPVPPPSAPPAATPSPPEQPAPPPPLQPPVPKGRALQAPVEPAPSPANVKAPPPEKLTGDTLARRVYDRDIGRDAVAVVEMVITSRSGHSRLRRFESRMLSHDGLQDSLIRFSYPADIEDTAFLTLERQGDDAEQFLYLPALRRERRIVAKQKGKSFVNSDLYYEDLERRAPEKDTHHILGEDKVGEWRCWILESVPVEEDSSAYGKNVAWIDQTSLLPVKGESFDRKQRKIKESKVHRIARVEGIWTIMDSEVTTLENGHTTRLTVQEIRYNQGLTPDGFTKRALRK